MSGPATLAWHDCRVTASVQGENPGSKGHGQPGWKPQCQAQRTSIPPSAGAACGRSHINGGSAWNASCTPTVMNSRFQAGKDCSGNSNIQLIHDKNMRLLLLRSLQTTWDRFGRTGMVEVGGVVVLLGTSLLRHPCRKTGNGGNVMCQLEVAGEALAGHHRADIREPFVRSSTMLAILAVRPRPVCTMAVDPRVGQFSSNYAEEQMTPALRRLISRCAGRGPSTGAAE